MGSGYSVQNTQTLVSVVTFKELNMLRGSSCSEYGGFLFCRHGQQTLPAYRVDLTYRVISAEQDKSVPLPCNRGKAHRKTCLWRCGQQSGRKRRPLCNRADTGCVIRIDHITGRESGPTSLRCFTRENEANRHMRQSR